MDTPIIGYHLPLGYLSCVACGPAPMGRRDCLPANPTAEPIYSAENISSPADKCDRCGATIDELAVVDGRTIRHAYYGAIGTIRPSRWAGCWDAVLTRPWDARAAGATLRRVMGGDVAVSFG